MRVLVTGGSGYLGRAIVRALAARGHEPVVFARRASAAGLPGLAVDGDIRDRASVRQAASGVDAIVHAAALVSAWHPQPSTFDDVNVGGLQATLEAARAIGIRRIVYTSSFLARPPADSQVALSANDYQRTKARAREVAHAAIAEGLPLVSLVPGVIYGPGAVTEGNLIGRMVADHLAGRLPGLIGAQRCWSYAYVNDVADAHVSALTPGVLAGEYLLGGENAPQMRVFEIVRDETGSALPRRIPFPLASAMGWLEEMRAGMTGRPPAITRGVVEILRHDWSINSARSVEKLNYHITPLETGIRALLAGSGSVSKRATEQH
jgi:nucleoside-diphosphate-sugar epimerase